MADSGKGQEVPKLPQAKPEQRPISPKGGFSISFGALVGKSQFPRNKITEIEQ